MGAAALEPVGPAVALVALAAVGIVGLLFLLCGLLDQRDRKEACPTFPSGTEPEATRSRGMPAKLGDVPDSDQGVG